MLSYIRFLASSSSSRFFLNFQETISCALCSLPRDKEVVLQNSADVNFNNKSEIESNSSGKEDLTKLLDESIICNKVKPANPEQVWSTSPYPKDVFLKRKQGQYYTPKEDPRESSVILFPGQGTQYVGMGKKLMKFPVAKDMFDFANDILGYNLRKLCFEGPQSKLDQTEFSQPAILVSSLAALEQLKEERPMAIENCMACAGFSVGEITALTFAGAIVFEDAVRLVRARGQAMQIASEMADSGMMTVLYGPESSLNFALKEAREWCIEQGIDKPECVVANYLFPHCKVIAGHTEALKYIENNFKEYKLKRVKWINVSGAFHTDLMRPAVAPFKAALKKIELSDPLIPVHSNVDGKRYKSATHIFKQLPKQIYTSVKWEQTLHSLYERPQGEYFPRTFECGPGTSLKTVLKLVNSKAWDSCFNVYA